MAKGRETKNVRGMSSRKRYPRVKMRYRMKRLRTQSGGIDGAVLWKSRIDSGSKGIYTVEEHNPAKGKGRKWRRIAVFRYADDAIEFLAKKYGYEFKY